MPLQRLPGLLPAATAARWLARLEPQPGGSLRLADALDLADVLQALAALHPRLGSATTVLASQCWVRRAQPPHHWHQDGALHHDFVQPRAPLPMLTCWIALTPCGNDAPGLGWVDAELPMLLPPAALTDAAVHARFPAPAFRHAVLDAGDALLFGGSLLHHTHVSAAMTQRRTSIELRFIADGPVPPALAGETLRRWA